MTEHTFTPEQVVNRLAWTAALRSGDYTQGKNHLYAHQEDGGIAYCCLGVAGEVLLGPPAFAARYRDGIDVSLTAAHNKAMGLDRNAKNPNVTKEVVGFQWLDAPPLLMSLNDSHGWDFGRIADWIDAETEAHLPPYANLEEGRLVWNHEIGAYCECPECQHDDSVAYLATAGDPDPQGNALSPANY